MNNGQQDDTSFQSFMDEGYDGLEESRATNEWKINRVDSFNKESLGRVSDRILKKVTPQIHVENIDRKSGVQSAFQSHFE
jgi:hypothetical protein